MVVDAVMGRYGDLLFGSALAVYVLAMILHAVEHGLLRRTSAETAQAAEPAPVAVGAGAADAGPVSGGVASTTADDAGSTPGRRPRSRAERFGRTGVALTVLGFGLHIAMLGVRGFAAGRAPWGNMYEFTAAISLVAVGAWLVVLARRPELRRLGAFVLLPVVVLMFLAGTVLYTQTAPVVPALRSYWLAIHVTAAVVSSGILLVAGVASVLYLLRSVNEAHPDRLAWTTRIPGAAALDRVAYRATAFAFPIWTFAVLTGAIWAEAAWGRYWGWDPKETTAFIAWVVYAAYLHARSTAGWRGRRAAVVNIVGFAVMVFNLFFVNLVVTGLHSYAGLG
jgi:cytochrome c-type biogenesis protein CcsB